MAKVTMVFEDNLDEDTVTVNWEFTPEADMNVPPTPAQMSAFQCIQMVQQIGSQPPSAAGDADAPAN